MVPWRCLIASGLISLMTVGCSNSANSSKLSAQKTQQVLEENNVSQLWSTAKVLQKAESLLQQGNNYLDAQRYQDALTAYDKAITIKANSVDLWINRGDALASLGRNEEALTSYEKAIAIQPNQDEAWFNKGNVLTNLNRYQEAVKAYDEAIAIKSDKKEAWINRGIALTRLEKYNEGLASYNKALDISSNLDKAYYNKACNYALQNNLSLAIENLQKAIKLVPEKYRQLARTDPDFGQVRSDPKFQELIK